MVDIDLQSLAKKGLQGIPFVDVRPAFNRDDLMSAKFVVWRL